MSNVGLFVDTSPGAGVGMMVSGVLGGVDGSLDAPGLVGPVVVGLEVVGLEVVGLVVVGLAGAELGPLEPKSDGWHPAVNSSA